MDKSKMAKQGTVIHYNPNKGGIGHDQMSRRVEQTCYEWCCCDKCRDAKNNKSLDDTLNPPPEDDGCQPCCG
jgi:hypothetical protein